MNMNSSDRHPVGLTIRRSATRRLQEEHFRICNAFLAAMTASAWLCGCSATKEKQVEEVARDWSKTIRASQVIPIYPLTEDLQPGDIFLVQVPVDRQQAIYKEKGYLPLDNHIARLHPSSYHPFYGNSFVSNGGGILPREWIRPGQEDSWHPAPHSAFPTYSFSVKRGAGINVAVPVSGVPVGLGLLGSSHAEGTISIRKAATLGIDTLSLYRELQRWALTNADFLASFAPSTDGKQRNYLRIVTRVYATGEMDVSLASADTKSGGLDAGAPKPVNLLYASANASTNTAEATVTNYRTNLALVNEMLAAGQTAKDAAGKLLPGGSLRVTSASSRAITLKETFPYPLVIGYLGFDCLIQRGGTLGYPIPTHSVLEKNFGVSARFNATPTQRIYAGAVEQNIYQIIADMAKTSPEAKLIQDRLDGLQQFIPVRPVRYEYDPGQKLLQERASALDGAPASVPEPRNYLSYRMYIGDKRSSATALGQALAEQEFRFQCLGATNSIPVNDDTTRRRLEQVRLQVTVNEQSPEQQEVRETLSSATSYFLRTLTQ